MKNESEEKRKKEVRLFRYGVISDFVNGIVVSRAEKSRLIEEKCSRRWQIPSSGRTYISTCTLYRWIRQYRKGGLEALSPQRRSDHSCSRAIDNETGAALIELRKKRPNIAIKELIKQMIRLKLVTPGTDLKPVTVYRFLHQNGLMEQASHQPVDRRRFEAELPNDLWQSDVMHGPYVEHEGKRRKTYLIALIDDHSRLIPYARFYLNESLSSYLDALYHALAKRGLPRKLFVDNGAAFRSHKLQYVTASLNINLIHSRPYQPEGKGKIERWFKTVRCVFLPTFTGSTLDDLNAAFQNWLDTDYHRRIHSSTDQSPFERFTRNLHGIRLAPSNLQEHFRTIARRRVSKDRVIVLNGLLFEAPVCLVGKTVELVYHDSALDKVEVRYANHSYGILTKVSLHANCRVKRDANNKPQIHAIGPQTYSGGSLFDGKAGKK